MKYLKSVTDGSVITYDKTITATDSASANITSIVPTNFYDKKLRYKMDCYILHPDLLMIILLFKIANRYHYSKNS